MSRIELAPQVLDDLRRIQAHLQVHDSANGLKRMQQIVAAIDVSADNPLIGRALENSLHELVIGRGADGYVALYKYLAGLDVVLVLALRGQREAGYVSEGQK